MAKSQEIAVVENGKVYVLQAGTPIFVKTADICAITGKSNQWIGQLTSQGILNKTRTAHGALYDISTLRSYCEMLEERSISEEETDPEIKKMETDRKRAETSMKVSKALIESLKAKEMQGSMHRSEDVAIVTADLIYSVRSALLALPGRMAVELASINEPAEASAYIQQEIYKVLEDIAAYQYDPKKYEELVRARMNREPIDEETEDNG